MSKKMISHPYQIHPIVYNDPFPCKNKRTQLADDIIVVVALLHKKQPRYGGTGR